MSALRDALRAKFRTPQEVTKVLSQALGLDEALLRKEATMKPTKFASTALHLCSTAVQPFIAKDAKVDLAPAFAGLTRQNFDKGKLKMALDTALKGKIAKDEEPKAVGSLTGMLDHIEHMTSPTVADESVSEAQHNAMGAAAGGKSNLGIPQGVGKEFMKADAGKDADPKANLGNFLKEKGVGDEDIAKACDMAFPPKPATEAGMGGAAEAGDKDVGLNGAGDESEEDKRKREEEEAKAKAQDKMITKDEMNTAVKSAIEAERANGRAIQAAFAAVKPWVGDLAMDDNIRSATDVHRKAAAALGIKGASTLHADALLPIIEAQPRPGVARAERGMAEDMASDAAMSDFAKMFPGADHIVNGPAGY